MIRRNPTSESRTIGSVRWPGRSLMVSRGSAVWASTAAPGEHHAWLQASAAGRQEGTRRRLSLLPNLPRLSTYCWVIHINRIVGELPVAGGQEVRRPPGKGAKWCNPALLIYRENESSRSGGSIHRS